MSRPLASYVRDWGIVFVCAGPVLAALALWEQPPGSDTILHLAVGMFLAGWVLMAANPANGGHRA